MKMKTAAFVLLITVGCGAPPTQSTPSSSAPTPTIDAQAAAFAAQEKAQHDALVAQYEAQKAQQDQAMASIAAQQSAAATSRAAAFAAACETSRPARAAELQRLARAERDFKNRVASRDREIRAACTLTLTKTGNVQIQQQGSSYRVSAEKREGVSCPHGPPKGLTEEDVWLRLTRLQPGAVDDSNIPYENDGQFINDNRACRESDTAAGLDTEVTPGDGPATARLLAWTPGITR